MKDVLEQTHATTKWFINWALKTRIIPLYYFILNKKLVRPLEGEISPVRRSCVFIYSGLNGTSMSFHLPHCKSQLVLGRKSKFPLPHDPTIQGIVRGKSLNFKKGVETFRVECKIGKPITHSDLFTFSDFMCKKGGWKFYQIVPIED